MVIKQHVSGNHRHPVLGTGYGRRWFMTTSRDTTNWTPLVDRTGDFDEIDKALYMEGEGCWMLNNYGISLFAYHGVYLGIQWVFRMTDPKGAYNCHGGPMDGRLLFAREWNRPWRIPSRKFIIPRGRKGELDWGMICGIANRPDSWQPCLPH